MYDGVVGEAGVIGGRGSVKKEWGKCVESGGYKEGVACVGRVTKKPGGVRA